MLHGTSMYAFVSVKSLKDCFTNQSATKQSDQRTLAQHLATEGTIGNGHKCDQW